MTPHKDIDGANPLSLGRLTADLPAHPPATAAAVMALPGGVGPVTTALLRHTIDAASQ